MRKNSKEAYISVVPIEGAQYLRIFEKITPWGKS